LSAFAKGIRAGMRVDQGEVIGYVGMSGDATGPHLDYRISKHGVFVNPLAELAKMPKGDPIAPREREAFLSHSGLLMTDLRDRLAAATALTSAPAPVAALAAPEKIR
jgi:hypothetical protein